jgi:hypothetical protein
VTIVVSYSGLSNNGHRTNKRWRIPKGQSKKDNPEELTTMVTGHKTKKTNKAKNTTQKTKKMCNTMFIEYVGIDYASL